MTSGCSAHQGDTNGKVVPDAGKRSATPATPPTGTPTPRTAKGGNVKGATGDIARYKCMELIYDALAFDSGAQHRKENARHESATYSRLVARQPHTRPKSALFINLKDLSLRESVVSGEITERKAADLKIKDASLFNSLGVEEQEADSEMDAFQCSRCKQVGVSITLIEALIVYPSLREKLI
ncbi:hypothetical protein F5887DRAFT_1177006 [Amanita rubescens]|nr:hypothetical protein F5887DRAFT_1177006 [Amanita rubescens]